MEVLVRVLPRVEQRSGFPGSVPTRAEAYDLVIHVGEIAGAILGSEAPRGTALPITR
jgi:hypothetical protein